MARNLHDNVFISLHIEMRKGRRREWNGRDSDCAFMYVCMCVSMSADTCVLGVQTHTDSCLCVSSECALYMNHVCMYQYVCMYLISPIRY